MREGAYQIPDRNLVLCHLVQLHKKWDLENLKLDLELCSTFKLRIQLFCQIITLYMQPNDGSQINLFTQQIKIC